MSSDAKLLVLERIRKALGERVPESATARAAEWKSLSRTYDASASLPLEARVDLLENRLRDYDAEVSRVADHQVAETIASVLGARGNRPTLLPLGFPEHWIPANASLTLDRGFSPRELDAFDGVITGASVAIAETGSLVLQHGASQGPRAGTLVPDFHLCVVRVEDIVENVPEAFARLSVDPTLLTFVSGPSATADIEMTRIKGVHGPRFLHVLLVID